MTQRPYTIESQGTVEIVDGELRIFNGSGELVASIRPDIPLWAMIAAQAVEQIRYQKPRQ